MTEFFIQLNFKNEGKRLVGPFKDEWIADLFLSDIPRQQYDKQPEYLGIESAIKISNYPNQLESAKDALRRNYGSPSRSVRRRGGE